MKEQVCARGEQPSLQVLELGLRVSHALNMAACGRSWPCP
jgi:hypothetical protein